MRDLIFCLAFPKVFKINQNEWFNYFTDNGISRGFVFLIFWSYSWSIRPWIKVFVNLACLLFKIRGSSEIKKGFVFLCEAWERDARHIARMCKAEKMKTWNGECKKIYCGWIMVPVPSRVYYHIVYFNITLRFQGFHAFFTSSCKIRDLLEMIFTPYYELMAEGQKCALLYHSKTTGQRAFFCQAP